MNICVDYYKGPCPHPGICGRYNDCPKRIDEGVVMGRKLLREIQARLGTISERPGDLDLCNEIGHILNNALQHQGMHEELAREIMKERDGTNTKG
jgi:hypothetical protein